MRKINCAGVLLPPTIPFSSTIFKRDRNNLCNRIILYLTQTRFFIHTIQRAPTQHPSSNSSENVSIPSYLAIPCPALQFLRRRSRSYSSHHAPRITFIHLSTLTRSSIVLSGSFLHPRILIAKTFVISISPDQFQSRDNTFPHPHSLYRKGCVCADQHRQRDARLRMDLDLGEAARTGAGIAPRCSAHRVTSLTARASPPTAPLLTTTRCQRRRSGVGRAEERDQAGEGGGR